MIVYQYRSQGPAPAPISAPPRGPYITHVTQRLDPAERLFTAEEAEDLVGKMRLTGVVTDIDVNPIYTYVDVGRPWEELTYKQKHICALALHRYSVLHGGSKDVAIRDAYTNRKIATYVSGAFSLR